MKKQTSIIGTILIIILMLLSEFACNNNNKQEDSTMNKQQIAETLIAMEKSALERWRQGDPDGFLEIIAEDYTYFDPAINTRVDNYEAIKEIYESIRGQINFERFELIDPKVQVEDDIAVLTFNFKSYGLLSDTMVGESSHWHTTEVFRKFEEDWRLISTHWSFTQPQLIKSAGLNALPGEPTPVKKVSIPSLSGQVAETVLGMERAALDRWGDGDPSGYIEITADDYTYFDPSLDKRLDGLAASKEYLEPIRGKIHIDRDEIINPRVQTDGTTAVLTFNFKSYKIDENGEENLGSHWHSTEIYRNIEGNWKLISTHWSYTQSMLMKLAESGAFNVEGE